MSMGLTLGRELGQYEHCVLICACNFVPTMNFWLASGHSTQAHLFISLTCQTQKRNLSDVKALDGSNVAHTSWNGRLRPL